MTTTSILIYCDNDLQLFEVGFVNQLENITVVSSRLLGEIKRNNRTLQLAEFFEPLWIKVLNEISLQPQFIFFLVGPKAGFTDTRVVYMWIRTLHLFSGCSYYIHKLVENNEWQNQTATEQALIIQQLLNSQNTDLTYSNEPRIGTKE